MGRRRHSYIACVTCQYGAERIIREAHALAQDSGSEVYVLSVLSDQTDLEQLEIMEHLHECARQASAQMTVLLSDNPALAAIEYIEYKKITHVVTGSPGEGSNGFIDLISSVLPKVKLVVLPNVMKQAHTSACAVHSGAAVAL